MNESTSQGCERWARLGDRGVGRKLSSGGGQSSLPLYPSPPSRSRYVCCHATRRVPSACETYLPTSRGEDQPALPSIMDSSSHSTRRRAREPAAHTNPKPFWDPTPSHAHKPNPNPTRLSLLRGARKRGWRWTNREGMGFGGSLSTSSFGKSPPSLALDPPAALHPIQHPP